MLSGSGGESSYRGQPACPAPSSELRATTASREGGRAPYPQLHRSVLREGAGGKELSGFRRGGRAVEGSGLENRQGRKSFVSSNLTHAATPSILRQAAAAHRGQVAEVSAWS